MVGKRVIVIFVVLFIFFSIVVIYMYMYSWMIQKGVGYKRRQGSSAVRESTSESTHLGYLELENYVVTRLSPDKALLRVYGANKSNLPVRHFPIDISYFSREGRFLGQDSCDLLADRGVILKSKGKFNAEVTLTLPRDTYKVTVDIGGGN